jgi:hypothetical protein
MVPHTQHGIATGTHKHHYINKEKLADGSSALASTIGGLFE